MKLLWEYPIGFEEDCSGYRCEGPIHIQGDWLYFVSSHPLPILHILNRHTGTGREVRLICDTILPAYCLFFPVGEDVILYCRDLFLLRDGQLHRTLPMPRQTNLSSHLRLGDRLYLVFKGRDAALVCVDIRKMQILWEIDVRNDSPYTAGPVTPFGDRLACFGRDKLLYIDPDTGSILEEMKLPRIGKLFQPTDLGDGKCLLGYSNWSNAGVLCLDTATKKILWRHKRNFEGPLLRCRYWLREDRVFWAKNDTELCCVSLRDGAELYRHWTDPWLYTDLDVTDDGLVFGTSGGDGFLRCLDPMTGEERWKHAMKDGCAFYTRRENSIFTGDCSCRLFRIRSSDGAILQTLDTGTEVVGQFLVHGNSLYTVIWCTDTIPCRLIRVEI